MAISPTTRFALGELRSGIGRFAAAGVAIVIGTAFVAATLLAGSIITRATYDQVSAQYADSDLVVFDSSGTMTSADLRAVRAADGTAAADGFQGTYAVLNHGGRSVYQSVVKTPADPRLSPLVLAGGTWPTGRHDIALPVEVAEIFDVSVGDSVSSTRWLAQGKPGVGELGAAGGEPRAGESRAGGSRDLDELTVSGLVDDPSDAYAASGGVAVITPKALTTRLADQAGDAGIPGMKTLVVALDRPGDGAAVAAAEDALLAAVPSATGVTTPEQYAEDVVAGMSDGQNILFLVFVLSFAAVALVIAGLVIANTFQVLVAQRSRTLALLRCVGASTGQIHRAVLLQAVLLGVVASLAGIVLGVVLVQVGPMVAPAFDVGVALPEIVPLSVPALLVPFDVGLLVTFAAAIAPARAASRVAPLAALRPADMTGQRGAGRVRAVLAGLATFGGLAALAGGVAIGMAGRIDVGLFATVLGGSVSLVGVVVGSVFWLPRVAAGFSRLVGAAGPAARLASVNALRNPRRTAATSTALLVGVALVSMMTTGAASARVTMDHQLDARYPVDLQVSSTTYTADGAVAAVPGSVTDAVAGVQGLRSVVEVTTTSAERADGGKPVQVASLAPAELRSVVNTPADASLLGPGVVVVPEQAAKAYGLTGLDTLELTGPGGDVTLDVVHSGSLSDQLYLTPQDLAAFDPDLATNEVWASVDADRDAEAIVSGVQDAVSGTGETVVVAGIIIERHTYQEVVDMILGIVVGLLGVAVLIALIGVANTLSLSVIERTKENAVLRAIGLTKGQLRATLAVEGAVIAGVGAVLGVLLGLVYGWSGAATALSGLGPVPFVVPWLHVAVVLGISVVAGLVASVLPARTAVRTPPVAALAAP